MATRKTTATEGRAAKTKKDLQAAYQTAVEDLKEKEQAQLRPEKQLEEKQQQETVAAAETLVADSRALQDIAQLKISIGKMLGQLTEQLEGELRKYETVRAAVTARERELQEIYEIQKSANSLAALIEAENQQRAEFENEMAERRAVLETEIAEARERWQKEKAECEQAQKAQKDADKRQRDREKEQFDYEFQREQTLARNKFADETGALEKEMQTRRDKLEKELVEREREVAARETELRELRTRVETLTSDRDTAVTQAVESATQRLQTQAKTQLDLLQKESDGERNVLTTRIEAFEKTVKDQAAQITRLTGQLDTAYGKVQDIAVRAIEGSASAKALQNLQSILAENVRKPAPEK